MIAIIYRHTLTLRSNQNNDFSPLTLMSTDIDRIVLCFENLPSVWARFIEVVIAVTLLILQMGWVAVIPLVVVGRGFQIFISQTPDLRLTISSIFVGEYCHCENDW